MYQGIYPGIVIAFKS